MKVLVVGYAKTGTKSMTAALKELGYDVHDFDHQYLHCGKEWIRIFNCGGTKEDFYRMYKDVEACCDVPASIFWQEILEAFPDLKMIFMRRKSEEEWMRSVKKQQYQIEHNYTMKIMAWFSPKARAFNRYCHYLNRIMFFGPSEQYFFQAFTGISPTLAKKRYRDHNASIVLGAPKEQTLYFNVTEGWEPLCRFLGKPVPDVPFPNKNRKAELWDELIQKSPVVAPMIRETKIGMVVAVVLIALLIFRICAYG